MSIIKLMSRIVAPSEMDRNSNNHGDDDAHDGIGRNATNNNHRAFHDHTYGITSDPLTQFSIVLSSLMHDVRCRGHNWQLLLLFLCVHAVIIALTLFSLAHPH